jgi:hypothetical protein
MSKKKSPGVIQRDTIYHIEALKQELGWSKHAMRTARRRGLTVIYTAGRAYVRGDDVLAYFDRVAKGSQQESVEPSKRVEH